jgi:hypothetical protein
MTTEISDYSISGSIINDTTIGILYPSTGNFNKLTVNNTGVLVSGQLYLNNIVDLSGGVSGLNSLGNVPSGTYLYTTGLNVFTTGSISSFARTILDDANADAVKNTLGLSSLSTVSGVLVLGSDVAQDIILSNISGSGTIFNNEKKDIDLIVKGTGVGDLFFYDASTGRLGINTASPDAVLHVVSDCALDGLKVETTTNCTTGVKLWLQHNPGVTPVAGSFPATIALAGRDDNANVVEYAKIRSKAVYVDGDGTDGTQGELLIYVDHDGSDNLVLRLANSGTYIGPHNTVTGGSSQYNLMGSGNNINGNAFIVLGNSNSADPATNNIILGNSNDSFGANNLLVGRLLEAQGSGNTVCGFTIYQDGDNNKVYSSNVLYTGDYAAIIGNIINGSGNYGVLLGNNLYNSGNINILIGSGLNNVGNSVSLFGNNLFSRGQSGIVIGANNAVTGDGNFLMGNRLNVISSGLYICGDSITATNVVDSLILEKNVTVSNASGIVIVGRGNDITSTNNVLGIYGYQNTTRSNIRNSNILGDSNSLSNASGSLVLGSSNVVSGTINNDIVIGKQNYLTNASNNNIFIGNLNNQSGLKLNNNGSITGSIASNNSRFINTLAIGNQNVFQESGNLQISVGNKNDINGLYGITIGNINTLRNSDNDILVGKSNYVAGPNNIIVANGSRVLGNNNVILSPAEDARVFGQDVVSIGSNNGLQSNGTVIGYDNNLYGNNNNVIGSNNSAGLNKYLFTATITSSQFASASISFNTDLTSEIQQGNEIYLYVYDPVPTDNNSIYVYERTVSTIAWNGTTTSISLNSNVTLQQNNPQSNPSNFDAALLPTTPTLASGYVIKKVRGSNNYIYGDLNTISYGTGNTVVGYRNNITSGTGNLVIGHALTHTGNNNLVIGASDTTKVIVGPKVIFNTGLSTTDIYSVGTNNTAYFHLDNTNNRVGIGNTSPRSTVDITGTLTTTALRIGLSGTNNNILSVDGDGFITSASRTTSSGLTYGMLYKISDTLSSGIDYMRWDTTDNALVLYNWDDPSSPSSNPDDWIAGCILQPNSGAVFNANHSYYGDSFNLTVNGSGDIGDYPILLRSEVDTNRLFIYHAYITSGIFSGGVKVSGNLHLPNLRSSGTLLSISSDSSTSGQMIYSQILPNTVLSTTNDFKATGYLNLRWFEADKRLCLGNTTTHTDNNTTFVESDYNTIISNTPRGDGYNYTVFNRDGLGAWPGSGFVVLYSGGGASERGLRIDYLNQKIGINTTPSELAGKTNALVVNGSIYGTALRIGEAATSGYALVAVDSSGNLGFRPINLDLTSSTIAYPFVLETLNNITKLKLTSYDESSVAFSDNGHYNDLGRILAWNGDSDSWYSPPHLRLYKGTSTSQKHGILFGEFASNYYIPTQNLHAFSAGSFHSTDSTYEGSTQYLQFYMRGSGNGAGTCDLSTDFSYDDADNTPNNTNSNVIKMPSADQLYHAWMYEAMISVLGINNTTNAYSAGAIKLVGAIKRIGSGGSLANIGNYQQDVFADSALNGIGAEMVFSPGTAGAGTMTVRCTGIAGITTAWSATVKINQLSLPQVLKAGS